MKVALNWFDTGYRSTRPKKKVAKKVAKKPAKPKAARPAVRVAPVAAPAPPARKPKPPAVVRVAPVAAPAVVPAVARPARKRPAPAASGWAAATYDVVHQSGRLRSVSGEVLLPGRVWGVNTDENGAPMLAHLPTGALMCRGSSFAALKKAAASIPEIGPGWDSPEFLRVARAILARKSYKTPSWWGEASDAIRSVCP